MVESEAAGDSDDVIVGLSVLLSVTRGVIVVVVLCECVNDCEFESEGEGVSLGLLESDCDDDTEGVIEEELLTEWLSDRSLVADAVLLRDVVTLSDAVCETVDVAESDCDVEIDVVAL